MMQAFLPFVFSVSVLLAAAADAKDFPGEVACSSGCVYSPRNVVQMQACGTIGQQNMVANQSSVNNFFSCQLFPTKEECNAGKSSPDGILCGWAIIPEKFPSYGEGTCVFKGFEDIANVGFQIAFPFLDKLKEEFGIQIPIAQHQAECLQNSWNQTACEGTSDSLGEKCGWCGGLDNDVYRFNPPTNGVCFQSSVVNGVCKMLKEDAKKQLCGGQEPLPTHTPTGSPSDPTTNPATDPATEATGSTRGKYTTAPSNASTLTASSSLLAVVYSML